MPIIFISFQKDFIFVVKIAAMYCRYAKFECDVKRLKETKQQGIKNIERSTFLNDVLFYFLFIHYFLFVIF